MKNLFLITIVVFTGVVLCISFAMPTFLSQNEFLSGFINHEILNILAVIMTVTAASAANIHLTFNSFEDKLGERGMFDGARREINSNVYWLIGAFSASIVALIIKSAITPSDLSISLINSFCLVLLLVNILVLIDVTKTTLNIRL